MKRQATKLEQNWLSSEIAKTAKYDLDVHILDQEVAKLGGDEDIICFDIAPVAKEANELFKGSWVVVGKLFGYSEIYAR